VPPAKPAPPPPSRLPNIQRMEPSFDVTFIAFQRLQQLRQGAQVAGGLASGVMQQIKMEKCRSDSVEMGLLARKKQMEFWQELCQPYPSLSHLDSIGIEYEHSIRRADRGFVTVLQLDPTCVPVMRKYAQFLIEVRPSESVWERGKAQV
jgi:hypothetical protein